jgi:hypothetical protein
MLLVICSLIQSCHSAKKINKLLYSILFPIIIIIVSMALIIDVLFMTNIIIVNLVIIIFIILTISGTIILIVIIISILNVRFIIVSVIKSLNITQRLFNYTVDNAVIQTIISTRGKSPQFCHLCTCQWCQLWAELYGQSGAQSTYIYRAPQCMSPCWNWDSPTPLAASECALPPRPKGGGAHSPAAKGVGESQFQRLE